MGVFLNLFITNKPNFRAVYDNGEQVEFLNKLKQRIRHHDKDIERLCNVYYQGFIESIRELLEVRSQAKKLNVSQLFDGQSIVVACNVLRCRMR